VKTNKNQSGTGFGAFRKLLLEAEALFGGVQRRLAAELEIDPTRYNKLRGGEAYTLNVENCLRLAAILKRSPTEVLRAANKTAIAEALEAYYGTPKYEPLPGGHLGRRLADEWARLSAAQRVLVVDVAAGLPTGVDGPPQAASGSVERRNSRRRSVRTA
jgi:hypothetical protein